MEDCSCLVLVCFNVKVWFLLWLLFNRKLFCLVLFDCFLFYSLYIVLDLNEGIVSHLKQKPCPVHGGQQGHWDNVNGGEVRNETDELQYILLTFGFRAVSDNWPLLFVQTSNSVSL
jgi:hypothetical protein